MTTVFMRFGLTGTDYPEETLKSRRDSPRWSVTAGIFRDLAAAAAAKGVPTLFVLVPAPYQINAHTLGEFSRGFGLDADSIDVDQPTTQLLAAMTTDSLRVFDALPGFRAADQQGIQTHGNIDRHLTPEGHVVLEGLLEDSVAALLARKAGR
jgi:hypothetical protein